MGNNPNRNNTNSNIAQDNSDYDDDDDDYHVPSSTPQRSLPKSSRKITDRLSILNSKLLTISQSASSESESSSNSIMGNDDVTTPQLPPDGCTTTLLIFRHCEKLG